MLHEAPRKAQETPRKSEAARSSQVSPSTVNYNSQEQPGATQKQRGAAMSSQVPPSSVRCNRNDSPETCKVTK